MKNNILIYIGCILLALSLALNYGFYKYAGKHEIITDSVLTIDTLWLTSHVVDSVPKPYYTTIIKCDTVYKKENDTIKAYPLFIKKKLIRTQ